MTVEINRNNQFSAERLDKKQYKNNAGCAAGDRQIWDIYNNEARDLLVIRLLQYRPLRTSPHGHLWESALTRNENCILAAKHAYRKTCVRSEKCSFGAEKRCFRQKNAVVNVCFFEQPQTRKFYFLWSQS